MAPDMTRRQFGARMAAMGAAAATGSAALASGGETSTLDVDVLVVGGGVQGLSVLYELRRRGVESAFLVTRELLGAGETLHSHGYMMRGYAVPPDAPIAVGAGLSSAFDWWSQFLADRGAPEGGGHPTYAGTADPAVVERWKELRLPFEAVSSLPPAFAGGHYARGGRLFRTQERLFSGPAIVGALAREVAGHAGRGEVTAMRCNAQQDRIESCDVRVGDRLVRFRAALVVLAAGRNNQALLRGVRADGSTAQPFAQRLKEAHVVRDVPMILVRGQDLPDVSGFFLDGKLSMATHEVGAGERMWIVTPLGGHATTREDAAEPRFDTALVKEGLERLRAILPAATPLLAGGVRLSAYFGPKVDHPSGAPLPFVGDAGVSNLRHVWPVVLTLARPAAVEVVRRLEDTEAWREVVRARRPLDPRVRALAGVGIGTEQRLSDAQRWYSPAEFSSLLGT
jgi:glycine/D-amino acid oxidase-like deaminating enzyme